MDMGPGHGKKSRFTNLTLEVRRKVYHNRLDNVLQPYIVEMPNLRFHESMGISITSP